MTASGLVEKLAGKSIVLVGIMGSGKSSVGRRLAARLGLDFADADGEIETAAGMTIPEIFAEHGEAYFRDGERRVICRLLEERQRVLATGGGAFMNASTRCKIADLAVSVWLKADHDVLMRRVRKRSNRPLLQSPDPDAVMSDLMEERYPVYATADITVKSGDGPHDVVVDVIIEALEKKLSGHAIGQTNGLAKVHVGIIGREYDILIGNDLLKNTGAYVSALAPRAACAIVTDETVARHHLKTLKDSLEAHGVRHEACIIPPGEQTKSITMFSHICDSVLGHRFERDDIILALGGGVVGDLSGFVAASLRRGMQFVQIPTTLLAQVDSSVGGKTAINSTHGKNLIGAFYQPSLVLADISTLSTLPQREFRAGYAEIVKYGLINDAGFFHWLEESRQEVFDNGPALREAIRMSCAAKAAIVARDENEQGERALLNLGHTFGHALEVLNNYNTDTLVHGEGVAIGIACAARFSVALGYMQGQDAARICAHLETAGLPTQLQQLQCIDAHDAHKILGAMYQDKKVKNGTLTFILMRAIGQSFIARGIEERKVLEFLKTELKAD